MTDRLTEIQKEQFEIASLYRRETQHKKELAEMKRKAKTSQDHFNVLFKELGRPVCNECKSVIMLYEMASFNRNGGYCGKCCS